ncbi:MAG TPA: hypothetical protein VFD13_02235 [Candidatus Kapabacteria bacterium]|nr:hypothetical protein [Candidatus Kapabacteria bacterium]
MKFISLVILILMMSYASSHAQDTTTTKLERAAYVVGAGLTFSLLDYVGYSLVRNGNRGPGWYRVLEGTVQAGISYFLYKECGLSSAVSFNLIWWTWGLDLGWYGWSNLINPASNGRWENRTWSGLHLREINWAGWTPIGLLRPQGSNIARDALIWQSVVGLAISIAIL